VITGYAVPQQPAPGAREDLHAPVRTLLGPGTERAITPEGDNPFGAAPLINGVEFAPVAAGWAYAVGVALYGGTESEPGWPEVAAVEAGVRISWPDGSTDLLS
jgi:hypothetical protein